jgi:hypothetical protein
MATATATATAMVLQAFEGLSDQEAGDRLNGKSPEGLRTLPYEGPRVEIRSSA